MRTDTAGAKTGRGAAGNEAVMGVHLPRGQDVISRAAQGRGEVRGPLGPVGTRCRLLGAVDRRSWPWLWEVCDRTRSPQMLRL